MSKTHGQSTKESYRDDIETSRKQKTVYKNFEYMDDHSYCESKKLGVYLEIDDDEYYLYFFQEDGPRELEILRKFLEWRRSGKSNEIGHKGGGNKRNIYGFVSEEVTICMKINDKYVIRCATKPNSLYSLATSDIDEESFRSESDSSTYITNPEKLKIKNLPGWYSDTYKKIEKDSGIYPNFLIRMELTKIPEEYSDNDKWYEFLNQVRAKQYKIPIYFKNEILSMEKYETYENIDMVGMFDTNKIKELDLRLFIHNVTKEFYIESDSKYITVKNGEIMNTLDPLMIEWGIIKMFIVSKEYLNKHLKEFNTNINKDSNLRAEDVYGIYLLLNGKLTNYLPFAGKLLGDSRNNNIDVEVGQKNNGRFRMILIPNDKNCRENNGIFDYLIETRDFKPLTGFLEKSDWKKIKDISIKIYKGEELNKTQKKNKKKVIKKEKVKDGGVYIVYLGNGLFKFGMVTDYDNMSDRVNNHKSSSISTIEEYIDNLTRKELPLRNNCIVIYENKSKNPNGDEEKIGAILQEDPSDKITVFQCERSENKIREYFVCNDIDYIMNTICFKLTEPN
tara:strand:- start:125 stop:1813 length:1689 start_codon:yes stop_codon:yes gene_type:complete